MTIALKLLLRVVRRRLSNGEAFDAVLKDYPRLTEAEQAEVRAIINQ